MAFGGGKVILLGEHSVVYGRPALAAGLTRGVEATARVAEADALRIEPWGLDVSPDPQADQPLARAFHALLAPYGASRQAVAIDATVDLPSAAGLGCSAALGVAVAGAVDQALGIERDAEGRAGAALTWERVFHGNPSGIDTAVSAQGGVIVYRKGEPIERVHPRAPLRLVVAHSGEQSTTKEMVEMVARQHEKATERLDKTFDAIAAIVRNARLAIEAGDLRALGQLMDLNQALLNSLLVSTARIEELCTAALEAGALGAKLTGAGGGGCVIALVDTDASAEHVLRALEQMDAEVFEVEAGA